MSSHWKLYLTLLWMKLRHSVSKGLITLASKINPTPLNPNNEAYLQGFIEGHRFALEEDYSWMLQSVRDSIATKSDDEQWEILSSQ